MHSGQLMSRREFSLIEDNIENKQSGFGVNCCFIWLSGAGFRNDKTNSSSMNKKETTPKMVFEWFQFFVNVSKNIYKKTFYIMYNYQNGNLKFCNFNRYKKFNVFFTKNK